MCKEPPAACRRGFSFSVKLEGIKTELANIVIKVVCEDFAKIQKATSNQQCVCDHLAGEAAERIRQKRGIRSVYFDFAGVHHFVDGLGLFQQHGLLSEQHASESERTYRFFLRGYSNTIFKSRAAGDRIGFCLHRNEVGMHAAFASAMPCFSADFSRTDTSLRMHLRASSDGGLFFF